MVDDINTDIIIPMNRYVLEHRANMHRFAFEPLRFLSDGKKNPDFALNQKAFENVKALIVGRNFGCGSSREAAVWAIAGLGIKCIIGCSFGSIFFDNCFQNGILAITLDEKVVLEMSSIAQTCSQKGLFSIDLRKSEIISPDNRVWMFQVEKYRRTQLLEGLDDISLTLKKSSEIEEFRARDKIVRPWVYL